ncbi:hypothetical protein LX97_00053 [Nonlabens dokdonensis]|jgi:hypothetical protein|uniref:IrrE N-terminal-like domain-containing protein n=2 Tax=Nonlabens dokdonensis TaxID=328515 RepID=L7W1L3_NONDD|nr:hypothetical protein [Nonlabens dokdonensis]AGC75350.1 hypothetical protein DDD_0223 [Nonlabens dokdonensis DSW-6]PZX43054.1 hypothetical protein LX97_00053 [Nonlabens dokdonensis]
MNQNNLDTIIGFLNEIGIEVKQTKLSKETFLPGLSLLGNRVLVDHDLLKFPGDLLHEAGHIAVTQESERSLIGSENMNEEWPTDADEITAICWSYAACKHLNLDLKVVFHPNGYKKQSQWLIDQFENKNYLGLPMLEWMSMTTTAQFPKMTKWLR